MFDRIVRMTGYDIFNTPNDNSNTFSPVTSTTKNTNRLVTRSNSNHNTAVPGVQINIASTDKNAKSNKTILVPTQLTMRGIKQKPLNSSPKVLKLSNDKNVPNSSQVTPIQKVLKYHTIKQNSNQQAQKTSTQPQTTNPILISNSKVEERNSKNHQQQQQTRKEEVFKIHENTMEEDFINFYTVYVPFINGKRNYNVLKFKNGSEELNYDEKILDNPKRILNLIKDQKKYPIDVHVISPNSYTKEQLKISNDTNQQTQNKSTNQQNPKTFTTKTQQQTPKEEVLKQSNDNNVIGLHVPNSSHTIKQNSNQQSHKQAQKTSTQPQNPNSILISNRKVKERNSKKHHQQQQQQQQQTRKEEVFIFKIHENTREEDFIYFYADYVGKRNYNVLKFKNGREELNYDENILENPKSILNFIKDQNKYPIDVHVIFDISQNSYTKEQLKLSNDTKPTNPK
jgi:hypothetical protein